MSDTWVAVDGLGRTVSASDECGPVRKDKRVGIIYTPWHGSHGYDTNQAPTAGQGVMPKAKDRYDSPYDISAILADNPNRPRWGPRHAFHHFAESEWGYYLSDDEFVIRKHAQALVDAGVDVIILDVTNAYVYTDVYQNLCRIYRQLRREGARTPQLCFVAYNNHTVAVNRLYKEFYSQALYPELWFRWKGKPLLLTPTAELSKEILAFFTIRTCWAWSSAEWFGDGQDRWTYWDNCPQKCGWHEDPATPEQISVTTAQNTPSNIGRSFHGGKQPPPKEQRPELGLCFSEQWRRALEVDPEFILVVDWNEWTAMRFVHPEADHGNWSLFIGHEMKAGESWFVDQYTQEYSRAIEPMKSGHHDAYYYQMVDCIRRYKGVRPVPRVSSAKTIHVDGAFDDWADVAPEYRDTRGDVFHRDHPGWGRIDAYVDETGRNDFVTCKVARDEDRVFFHAMTDEAITGHNQKNWMLLFIDCDSDHSTGWVGYDVLINHSVRDDRTTTLKRWDREGQSWTYRCEIPYRVNGQQIELAVPRQHLNLTDTMAFQLDFHWADNIQSLGEIAEFALHGDSAPNRRFNYRYRTEP